MLKLAHRRWHWPNITTTLGKMLFDTENISMWSTIQAYIIVRESLEINVCNAPKYKYFSRKNFSKNQAPNLTGQIWISAALKKITRVDPLTYATAYPE